MQAAAEVVQVRDAFMTPRLYAGSLPAIKPATPANVAAEAIASTIYNHGLRITKADSKNLPRETIFFFPASDQVATYSAFAFSPSFAMCAIEGITASTMSVRFLGLTDNGVDNVFMVPWITAVGPVGTVFPVVTPPSIQIATEAVMGLLQPAIAANGAVAPALPPIEHGYQHQGQVDLATLGRAIGESLLPAMVANKGSSVGKQAETDKYLKTIGTFDDPISNAGLFFSPPPLPPPMPGDAPRSQEMVLSYICSPKYWDSASFFQRIRVVMNGSNSLRPDQFPITDAKILQTFGFGVWGEPGKGSITDWARSDETSATSSIYWASLERLATIYARTGAPSKAQAILALRASMMSLADSLDKGKLPSVQARLIDFYLSRPTIDQPQFFTPGVFYDFSLVDRLSAAMTLDRSDSRIVDMLDNTLLPLPSSTTKRDSDRDRTQPTRNNRNKKAKTTPSSTATAGSGSSGTNTSTTSGRVRLPPAEWKAKTEAYEAARPSFIPASHNLCRDWVRGIRKCTHTSTSCGAAGGPFEHHWYPVGADANQIKQTKDWVATLYAP